MADERIKAKTGQRNAAARRGGTAVSPQAMLSWSRVPAQRKGEILAAFERSVRAGDADVRTVRVGAQELKVRSMSSGFRVVFESGEDRDTIVSVLTPREAGFTGD